MLSRYGMNFSPALSAEMTFPSAESDLLMDCASLRRSADAPVFPTRSEPARSISESLPIVVFFVCLLSAVMRSAKTRCEREEVAFTAGEGGRERVVAP